MNGRALRWLAGCLFGALIVVGYFYFQNKATAPIEKKAAPIWKDAGKAAQGGRQP
jgi:hypothetical protein